MDVEDRADLGAAKIAAAIGEPARARMLYSLMDGRARTSTELAAIADVSASTASVHLQRLQSERLIDVRKQGKHRYYTLCGAPVARALEALNVLAGGNAPPPSSAPERLRLARTCYDHMAGTVAVRLHDRFVDSKWIVRSGSNDAYDVTVSGARDLGALGIDIGEARALRRRFAYGCLDWSERRPHVGGAVGAALLTFLLRKRWVVADDDTRALSVTKLGARELVSRLSIALD